MNLVSSISISISIGRMILTFLIKSIRHQCTFSRLV